MTTHMFSATMPPAMERLARKYLRNPVAVTVGFAGKAADLVAQNVVMVKVQEKMPRLTRILADLGKDRRTAIVFCNTKNSVEKLTNDLEYARLSRVTVLHGGKSQDERKASLDGFRNGRFNALVATDASGIDVRRSPRDQLRDAQLDRSVRIVSEADVPEEGALDAF
ncbi:hypothetical protein ZWY2020_037227 [Hordeum vulgare]|nr:hypothetical protein ZWY2020_037227 [Hordeum vulgare]